MGSMVPLEVSAAREERPQPSEPDSFQPQASVVVPQPLVASSNVPQATIVYHDLFGWSPSAEIEAVPISAVRDAVLHQLGMRRLTIAVTGAPGQQRAQLAAALAFSLAQSGARALLLEADFDRPELHHALALTAPPGAGFSQQLRARRPEERSRPWTLLRCAPNLSVMVEGRLRSPGQLASGIFEAAIEELRGHHHAVIIHAPSLNKRSDLRPLATLTQAAVLAQPAQPPSVQFGDGALLALL
jgi:Mrp family chromosome partitioning ATPase